MFFIVKDYSFFVALRPNSTAMVMAGRSVNLTTLFKANTSCIYFACNWQQPFLNDFGQTEKNDTRNYFMINFHESIGTGSIKLVTP